MTGVEGQTDLRAGNLRDGITMAQQCLDLTSSLRSVSALSALTPLRQAAERRRDSTCQDIARRVRTLQTAATRT